MKYRHYEFDHTLAEVWAVIEDRAFSRVPTPATAAWFLWSTLAVRGEWA